MNNESMSNIPTRKTRNKRDSQIVKAAILEMNKQGISGAEIGRVLGCSRQYVSEVIGPLDKRKRKKIREERYKKLLEIARERVFWQLLPRERVRKDLGIPLRFFVLGARREWLRTHKGLDWCPMCRQLKPVACFYDGCYHCIDCRGQISADYWRKKHPETARRGKYRNHATGPRKYLIERDSNIMKEYNDGSKIRELTSKYNLSYSAIWAIIHKQKSQPQEKKGTSK